ncbi:putative non-specific serine/threonine protein kinase [Helianthus annuus]|nr:putative non-specific serine/threonine protein kinase [Helianthus annuus]
METVKGSETVIKGLGKEKCVESVFAPVVERGCIDPCKVNGFDPIDSISRGGVNIKGISLFVELTGGVTSKTERESVQDVDQDEFRVNVKSECESICNVGQHQFRVNVKPECESVIDVGQHEFSVNVGDLVWAVIRKPNKSSWWPAVVCDGSDAPKAANGPTREDDYLLRCFGNGSYIWCAACEVKPFVGYFDQLPSQSTAKKFLDALDKAVAELGHRVKTEFTCSCFRKMKIEKAGNFGDLLLTRFEPAKLLDYIKDLAKVISVPNKIDYVVKQSCLSAFYRSLGHLQIPMHQLEMTLGSPSEVKAEEENRYFYYDFEKSEKLFETRERKKSRFLLYPGECGIAGSMVDVNEGVDFSLTNGQSQQVKKPRKKWTKKSKGVQLQANVCSSEVLSQLRFAGQDCCFPSESKNFDLVKRFISGLRKRTFVNDFSEIPIEMLNHPNLQETVPKKVKRKKDESIISPTLGNYFSYDSLTKAFQSLNLEAQSYCKIEPKRRKKTTENTTYTPTWNANMSTYPIVNGHMGGLYQASVSHFTNAFWSTAPCFTRNHCEPHAGLGPAGSGHVPKKRGRKKKNIDSQGNPGSIVIPVGRVPSGLGHVPKKRGRKRKNVDLQANSGSTVITNMNDGTEEKTEKKLNVKEVGVPCIDLSYKKVQQDNVEEVKGTAFLLKFSPDHPLPANQDLNLAFSKYGALVESETQVSNENLSGQVVFRDSSSAGGAFWGLQNDKLFGPVLVNYKIQHLSSDESMATFKTPIRSPSGLKPTNSQPLIGSTMTPNLNMNSTEIQTVKRSKTIEEVTGTALLLKFSPNHPLPSFQDLNSTFCKYGELNEFETYVSGQDFTGQVVFVNASTAGDAIQRLEKDQPFGPALVSYRVDHLYSVQSAIRFKSPVTVPLELNPCQDLEGTKKNRVDHLYSVQTAMTRVKSVPLELKPCEGLVGIKKNLEMMKSMLEKNGDSLSPEMRGKLESEIKGLMNKLNVMDGSSSSSCI